jgi:hypothetical protein
LSGRGAGVATAVLLYLGLCGATALVWEPSHDEGITWDQAVAHPALPAHPAAPAPVADLYAALEGQGGHSPAGVIAALATRDGMHPPAYYLFMHRWIRLAGVGRPALALPAALLGVAALLALRRIAERVAPGPAAGTWAMALLAVSPWFVGYTVLARPYAAALCLAILSSAALLEPYRSRPGARVAFAGLSILGLYTLYHYAFVLAWQMALLACLAVRTRRGERRRELATLAATGLVIAAAYVPWLPKLLAHLELTASPIYYFSGEVAASDWLVRSAQVLRVLLLGEPSRGSAGAILDAALLLVALPTAALAALSFARARGSDQDVAARAFWWTAPVLPASIAAADLWHGTHTLFLSKTCFALVALLLLLAVRGWQWTASRRVAAAGLALWCALLGAGAVANVAVRAASTSPYEAVAARLARDDDPSHRVVLSTTRPGYVFPLLLALRATGVERVQVTTALPGSLGEAVAAATGGEGAVSRLTLVNLVVAYERSSTWSRDELREARARASANGWAAYRVGGRRDESQAGQSDRVVAIMSPIQVGYFSR